jgi:hypothetical protein
VSLQSELQRAPDPGGIYHNRAHRMCYRLRMKRADDYTAKYALWASRPEVRRLPGFTGVPRFGVRRFGSYEEMNAWKRDLLREIARGGGLTWTR